MYSSMKTVATASVYAFNKKKKLHMSGHCAYFLPRTIETQFFKGLAYLQVRSNPLQCSSRVRNMAPILKMSIAENGGAS